MQMMQDYLLIEPIENTKTAGGIIIPDNAQEKTTRGKVLAIGPGYISDTGALIPMTVKVGDTVLFASWAGSYNELEVDGVKHAVIKQRDIIAIMGE